MIGFSLTVVLWLIPLLVYMGTVRAGNCTSCAQAWIIATIVLAGMWTAGNLLAQIGTIFSQIEDIEKIKEQEAKKALYVLQRDDLVDQATLYLGKEYPEHEKEIFRLITEKNNDALVNVLMTLPELKSAQTLQQLVKTIGSMQDNVYSQDHLIEKLKRKIRVWLRNPWMIRCFMPTYTEEVQP